MSILSGAFHFKCQELQAVEDEHRDQRVEILEQMLEVMSSRISENGTTEQSREGETNISQDGTINGQHSGDKRA